MRIKVIGVNTSPKKFSGGLSVVNRLSEKNFPNADCLAVDRNDIANLENCTAVKKFRLLNTDDEKILTENLRGVDVIFIAADEVWENITLTALTAHCAKKSGATVIFVAGGNFEYAEDEIIFDELITLPSENFESDAAKAVENFIENSTGS